MFCYLPQKISSQISRVRTEIQNLHINYSISKKPGNVPMKPEVYYDQLEELSSHLSHLKERQRMENSLEKWCINNPNDLECRTYDY